MANKLEPEIVETRYGPWEEQCFCKHCEKELTEEDRKFNLYECVHCGCYKKLVYKSRRKVIRRIRTSFFGLRMHRVKVDWEYS